MKRILVCGGRDLTNEQKVWAVLEEFIHDEVVIIEGNAAGADHLAFRWACREEKEYLKFPADWKRHGKAAGAIRNQQMINEGKPDLVIAFPTKKSVGTGTWSGVRVRPVSRREFTNHDK